MTAGHALGFDARRKARRPAITTHHWLDALELAERLALAAEDVIDGSERGSARLGDLQLFRVQVATLTAESFPMASEHARAAAGAFLNAGRAFAHALTEPEARTACAPLLREAAHYVDRLITLHRSARAAATWGRQQGGDR